MNIFYLHNDPTECAKQHNDKHVVKMILEYAQLLSTAHRVLDGHEVTELTANGRKIRRWKLESYLDNKLYKSKVGWVTSEPLVNGMSKTYEWINKKVLENND